MPLSKTHIAILTICAIILTPFAVEYVAHPPEIIRKEFSPPNKILYNGAGVLHFELTNYGEKTGSYFLSIESKEFLISKKQINNLDDDYKHNFSMSSLLPKDGNHPYNFNIKVNKTNLKPNANISLIYIDLSGFNPIKKKYIWNFYYERDSSNNYQFIEDEISTENFFYSKVFIRLSNL